MLDVGEDKIKFGDMCTVRLPVYSSSTRIAPQCTERAGGEGGGCPPILHHSKCRFSCKNLTIVCTVRLDKDYRSGRTSFSLVVAKYLHA
jgi:hypothetical protein